MTVRRYRIGGSFYLAESADSAYAQHMEGWRSISEGEGGFPFAVPVFVEHPERVVQPHYDFDLTESGAFQEAAKREFAENGYPMLPPLDYGRNIHQRLEDALQTMDDCGLKVCTKTAKTLRHNFPPNMKTGDTVRVKHVRGHVIDYERVEKKTIADFKTNPKKVCVACEQEGVGGSPAIASNNGNPFCNYHLAQSHLKEQKRKASRFSCGRCDLVMQMPDHMRDGWCPTCGIAQPQEHGKPSQEIVEIQEAWKRNEEFRYREKCKELVETLNHAKSSLYNERSLAVKKIRSQDGAIKKLEAEVQKLRTGQELRSYIDQNEEHLKELRRLTDIIKKIREITTDGGVIHGFCDKALRYGKWR
jgi:hypothetical protein